MKEGETEKNERGEVIVDKKKGEEERTGQKGRKYKTRGEKKKEQRGKKKREAVRAGQEKTKRRKEE